jgi:hypothetical protein
MLLTGATITKMDAAAKYWTSSSKHHFCKISWTAPYLLVKGEGGPGEALSDLAVAYADLRHAEVRGEGQDLDVVPRPQQVAASQEHLP